MIFHGDKKITKIFHGGREISRVYRGERLVYQAKLIPGVDYELHKWLKGDGAAFIFVGRFASVTNINHIKVKINSLENTTTGFFPAFRIKRQDCRIWNFNDYRVYYSYNIYNTNLRTNDFAVGYEVDFYNDRCVYNDTEQKKLIYRPFSDVYITIFAGMDDEETYFTAANDKWAINEFAVNTANGPICLRAVQLLHNIPPSVSADNRPHPAGECGMIDEISGKFYGNANSVGAFSVSND